MKSININSGFWVLLALAGFVFWVRHDFGKEPAIYSVIALIGAALVIVGLLFGLGFTRSTMSSMVDYERSQALIRKEYARSDRVQQQGDNILLRAALSFAKPLARQMIAMKGAEQISKQPEQEIEADYWRVDAEFERGDQW